MLDITATTVASALPDALLAKYCPVLYLHHEDEHHPVTVEWFVERAGLYYYHGGGLTELSEASGDTSELIAAGQVTQEKLLEVQAEVASRGQSPGNLSLTVALEHYGGICAARVQDVPIYVHAKLVVDEDGAPEAYEINYITFYAFNGAYNLPAGLPLFRHGHHVGDWEHLTVRLDAASLDLQGVWYNAHRNIEGEWCPAAQVPRSPYGRILGYVAINGHGIYPTCGTIPRIFFIANDRTSDRGPVWNPTRIVRLCGLAHGSGCPVVPSRGCSLPLPPAPHGCAVGQRGLHTKAGCAVAEQPAAGDARQADGAAGCQDPAGVELVPLELGKPVEQEVHGAEVGSAGVAAGGGPTASSAAASELRVVAQGRAVTAPAAGAAAPQGAPQQAGFPLPAVVHDASPWQRYEGRWGTVVPPALQGWFQGAEPPVSRGLLRRVFLPCAPGVDRLPRKQRPPPQPATAGAAAVGELKSA